VYLHIVILKLKTLPFTYLFLKIIELNLEYMKAEDLNVYLKYYFLFPVNRLID